MRTVGSADATPQTNKNVYVFICRGVREELEQSDSAILSPEPSLELLDLILLISIERAGNYNRKQSIMKEYLPRKNGRMQSSITHRINAKAFRLL